MKQLLGLLIISLLAGSACSPKTMSQRDLQKQKDAGAAETKKTELEGVAGKYIGELRGDDDYQQRIRLTLEVRSVPVQQEGSVDPIMVPKLLGGVRFILGSEEAQEFIDLTIKEGEFVKPTDHIELLMSHDEVGDLFMSVDRKKDGKQLTGTWRAPKQGLEGTIVLDKE